MKRTANQVDILSSPGTKVVLKVLCRRRARRVGDDVVGDLRDAAMALNHIKGFVRTIAASYFGQGEFADTGIEFVAEEFEPGGQVDRIGVAVWIHSTRLKTIPRDVVEQASRCLAGAIWQLRKRTHELSTTPDFFAERDDTLEAEWQLDDATLTQATPALVRAGRRHEIYLAPSRGAEQLVDLADVTDSPPKHVGSLRIDAVVDGHCWTKSEIVLKGAAVDSGNTSSLVGVQRNYTVKVARAHQIKRSLLMSAEQIRALWTLQEFECLVDGGTKAVEYRLDPAADIQAVST